MAPFKYNHFFFHIATASPEFVGEGFPPLLYHRVIGTSILKVTGTAPDVNISTYVDMDLNTESTIVASFFDKLADDGGSTFQLASFRGNSFALPVLTYRALAHGIDASSYLNEDAYFEPRFAKRNVDLSERFTNFGQVPGGSLNDYVKMVGLPGRPWVDFASLVTNENRQGITDSLDMDVFLIAMLYLRLSLAHGIPQKTYKEVGKSVMKSYYNYNEKVAAYLDKANAKKFLLAGK